MTVNLVGALDTALEKTLAGATPYDGQYDGEMLLLEGETEDTIFTEALRLQAVKTINEGTPPSADMVVSLLRIREIGQSIQAGFWLARLGLAPMPEAYEHLDLEF